MNNQKNWTENLRPSDPLHRDRPDREALNVPGVRASFSLVEFTPENASENLWMAYFTVSDAVFREVNPRGRLPNREAVRRLFSKPNPLYTVKRLMVLDPEERAVAAASIAYDTELSPDYEGSSHVCQIQISVVPACRRMKIATCLVKHMIGKAGAMGKDTVRADAENPPGRGFCKYLKGELIHQEVQHRSYLADVDWQLVEQWCEKGRARFPHTTIESFQECPESDIEQFCGFFTEIINQRPVGEIETELITTPESRRIEERNCKRRGTEWHTMISREPGGRISAMTDITYNAREPHRIHQYFTGVSGRDRGKGLAKRIKAEMLVYIRHKFPDAEHITTTTAKENKPMQAINKQLGFMPRKTSYMFRWDLQELARRVDKVLSASSLKTKR
ncbi:MAG: hypothetical protein Q8P24_14725 [Desulfobacterales bacterium]|nr:hypothetical protein [Desulfobacterales bacterium]